MSQAGDDTARIAVVRFTGKHPDDSIKTVSIEALATLKMWEFDCCAIEVHGPGGGNGRPSHEDVIRSEMIGISAIGYAG